VLLALWSPKGGSGTSVLAAACALVLGRRGGARLADLDGDQPALFGLAS
jgi:MinD superfamily P-loop ATPase